MLIAGLIDICCVDHVAFWVSILPFTASTLPSSVGDKPPSMRTQLSLPEHIVHNNGVNDVIDVGREQVVERTQVDDAVNCQQPSRHRRKPRRNVNGKDIVNADGKLSDYEDLWQTATPTASDGVILDPTKYQLSDRRGTGMSSSQLIAHRQLVQQTLSSDVAESGARRVDGSQFGRSETGLDVDSRQDNLNGDRRRPSAFEFDVSSLNRRTAAANQPEQHLGVPLAGSPCQRPSPIYAEPCDALNVDTRPRISSSVASRVAVSDSSRSKFRETDGVVTARHQQQRNRPQNDEGDMEDADDAVLSAGYRAPADALAPVSVSTSTQTLAPAADARKSALPPPAMQPPPPPSSLPCSWLPEVVVTPVDGDSRAPANCASTRAKKHSKAGSRLANMQELSDLLGEFGCNLNDGDATTSSQLSRRTCSVGRETDAHGGYVGRLTVSTGLQGRHPGYRSDYDNMSNDEDFAPHHDDDAEPLSPAPRSRLMTGSSMHTQYSPPWDGAPWRKLIDPDGEDNNNNEVGDCHFRRMSQRWPSTELDDGTGHRCQRTNCTFEVREVQTTSETAKATKSTYGFTYASSNLMYCDSSLRRDDNCTTTRSIANDSTKCLTLNDDDDGVRSAGGGTVAGGGPAARSAPMPLCSHAGQGALFDSKESLRQMTSSAGEGILTRRQPSAVSSRPPLADGRATGSAAGSMYSSLSRPPRHPVSRQASDASKTTLTRGQQTPSSACSTMTRMSFHRMDASEES
jgi:hypothetical protein